MEKIDEHDLAATVGTNEGRRTLLKEIVAKVDGFDAAGSDEDLDRWWGVVEVDRLASGLTLATISRLADPRGGGEPVGAWLLRADESGSEPTQLTREGREALRLIGSAEGG